MRSVVEWNIIMQFMTVIGIIHRMSPFQTGFFHLAIRIYISFMCFHGLLAHFFAALVNMLLSGCTTVCLSTHLLKDVLVASKFWQLWTNLLWTSVCRFLYKYTFSSPLSKYQGVWLLDCITRECLVLKETDKLSSKMAVPFCILTGNKWEFLWLHIFVSICFVSVSDFGHSGRSVMVFSYCFNLHFPDDIWYGASFHVHICHLHTFIGEMSHIVVF